MTIQTSSTAASKAWPARSILLDRGVIKMSGGEAHSFLQGLITNNMELLKQPRDAIYASLLTPQGKMLFDFFVVHAGDHLLIDVAEALTADLFKRLTFYKLRADVELENVTGSHDVVALAPDADVSANVILYTDPRHPALGQRAIVTEQNPDNHETEAAYHRLLTTLGFPLGGRDFQYGDAFAHEAMLDQLNGLDYRKGCYVGQEVVSRMHHRGTARKRILPFTAIGTVAPNTPVTAATANIGTVTAFHDGHGLATIRLDRAAEAKQQDIPLTAGDTTITLIKPNWVDFDVPV